jgi:fatty-acyl-CoA synthase
VAYVQLKPGATTREDELLSFAQAHIGERAAVPKRIQVIADLPTTAVGKIFKPALVSREIEDELSHAVLAVEGVASCCVAVRSDKLSGLRAFVEVTPATGIGSDALRAEVERALGQYATPHELTMREPAPVDVR